MDQHYAKVYHKHVLASSSQKTAEIQRDFTRLQGVFRVAPSPKDRHNRAFFE
jgi:hypothetical protein